MALRVVSGDGQRHPVRATLRRGEFPARGRPARRGGGVQGAADLRAGNSTKDHVAAVDARLDAILTQHTTVGARQNQLERAADTNLGTRTTLETRRAAIEDADIAELAIDLQLKQVAYQATLSIGASLLQPSLLDYIR